MVYSFKTVETICFIVIAICVVHALTTIILAMGSSDFSFLDVIGLLIDIVFIIGNFRLIFGIRDRNVKTIRQYKYFFIAILLLLVVRIVAIVIDMTKPRDPYDELSRMFSHKPTRKSSIWDIIHSVIVLGIIFLIYCVEVREIIRKVESDINKENDARNMEENNNNSNDNKNDNNKN
ncbi:hypothetical protein PIROE2DRAFT_17778 [Piromyces sp. E2]|nr:hypothetical protein PIROE2DRAFT_17778 [Piromyces sp. E2]|eukprot:OUM57292.1 hypothetical protein PIROE2DRAFT_17778 [Piromyces sp. E2]